MKANNTSMRGKIGTSMQVHSRFKNEKEYWKWVRLKNKPVKKKKTETKKHYRYLKDGEWVDVFVDK